jgi:DedD protein
VKERLTGAMILVALIVLLVPELLTGPLRATTKAAGADSSTEEAPLRSYTINLGDDGHAQGTPPSVTQESAQPAPLPAAAAPASHSAPPPVPAPTPPAPPPEQTPELPPRATPTPMARPVTPPPASGGWVVQLGSFASEANADRLAQQVKGQGFPVSVSQSASGRHLYRVRVGPVHEHTAALQLAQKLSAGGHAGTVEPR